MLAEAPSAAVHGAGVLIEHGAFRVRLVELKLVVLAEPFAYNTTPLVVFQARPTD